MKQGKILQGMIRTGVVAAALMVSAAVTEPSLAQSSIVSDSSAEVHAGEFVVPVNKSQVLRLDQPFSDLLVGQAEIADVLALTDRSIYVLGKQTGSTSLTVYGKNKELIAVVDLVVSLDVAGLKSRLFELLPDDSIDVRAVNGSIVLSGTISSSVKLARALDIAERYAPGQVSNLMSVSGSQQVVLDVRFAEVRRAVVKALGLDSSIVGGDINIQIGDQVVNSTTGSNLSGLGIDTFATGALGPFDTGKLTFDFLFDALEQKGAVKTLAEPNLIALSGDTASFLAGGEFPVPVAQTSDVGGTTITIEFKEFGVGLNFTPTVLEDGLVNVIVNPEVSRIDRTNGVQTSGLFIPGLVTRRASTTVELRDGQSFAIAGLIQSDFADTVRQFPGLGDVPVLSALMRSSEFINEQTELVIIVTAHLVQPVAAGSLLTPADNFVPPSDLDMFLFGRTESPSSGKAPGATKASTEAEMALTANTAGGIEGEYGHIIK